jgi:5-formyltetrahydrofolate cyclo-ligase
MTQADSKVTLRKQLRNARRGLSPKQQQTAAEQLVATLRPILSKQKVRRVAAYLAMDGELDLLPLMEYCWQHRIEIYLPVLHKLKPALWFARFDEHSPLYPNRFGIDEPLDGAPIRPWQLDIVLLPLVGFDAHGNRLGMGGGFYDRTFAHAARWPKRPKLMGVAHECQKVDAIPLERWDIRLDAIVSDRHFYQT